MSQPDAQKHPWPQDESKKIQDCQLLQHLQTSYFTKRVFYHDVVKTYDPLLFCCQSLVQEVIEHLKGRLDGSYPHIQFHVASVREYTKCFQSFDSTGIDMGNRIGHVIQGW